MPKTTLLPNDENEYGISFSWLELHWTHGVRMHSLLYFCHAFSFPRCMPCDNAGSRETPRLYTAHISSQNKCSTNAQAQTDKGIHIQITPSSHVSTNDEHYLIILSIYPTSAQPLPSSTPALLLPPRNSYTAHHTLGYSSAGTPRPAGNHRQ